MAWQTNERGRLFYVQKQRVGDQVIRNYFGSGETAELVAQLEDAIHQFDDLEKIERQQLIRQNQEEIARFSMGKALFIQKMEAAGYHRHKGGEWRKTRVAPNNLPQAESDCLPRADAFQDELSAPPPQANADLAQPHTTTDSEAPDANPSGNSATLEQLLTEQVHLCLQYRDRLLSGYYAWVRQVGTPATANLYVRFIEGAQRRLISATARLEFVKRRNIQS